MKLLVLLFALLAVSLGAPPTDRIIGGINAQRGEFPFQVSFQLCILTYCTHICGAAILSPKWILTAAHCITEAPSIGTFYVVAGILHLDDTNLERDTVRVSQTYIHPGYQGGVNPNDIALLELTSGLIFNDHVRAIALPQPDEAFVGQSVLSGWGSTGGIILPQMPNTLQKADLPLLPISECRNALDTILNDPNHPLDSDSNICTGPLTGGLSPCSGDSGGPLVQGPTLLGVVSWGITPCASRGAPSVYTKVSHFVNWIQTTVDEPLS